MKHLLHYTFEWQSLIFIVIAFIAAAYFLKIHKAIAQSYRERFTSEYKAERWHLHTLYSRWIIAVGFIVMGLFSVFQVPYFPIVIVPFMGLIFGYAMNFVREWYVAQKVGKGKDGKYLNPMDYNDIRHGAVGGMEGALIGFIVVLIIFFIRA